MISCSDFKDVFIDKILYHANPAVNFCSHIYMKIKIKLNNNNTLINRECKIFNFWSQPASKTMSYFVSRSASQSASQAIMSVRQSVSQSFSQSVSQPVSQSVSQLVTQARSQSVRPLISQPASQSVSQSISQSDSQSVIQAVRQSDSQSDSQIGIITMLFFFSRGSVQLLKHLICELNSSCLDQDELPMKNIFQWV